MLTFLAACSVLVSIVLVIFHYKKEFGWKKRCYDEYLLSLDILKNSRWKNASDIELQIWYRGLTGLTVDAPVIFYMFKQSSPLQVLRSYGRGFKYIEAKVLDDDVIGFYFAKAGKWSLNIKSRIKLNNWLYWLSATSMLGFYLFSCYFLSAGKIGVGLNCLVLTFLFMVIWGILLESILSLRAAKFVVEKSEEHIRVTVARNKQ